MKEFTDWLIQEMQSRNWGKPELVKAAHISRGAVGNILRGERGTGPEVCVALARALKLPPEVVFRKAGLLPPVPGEDIKSEEIKEISRQLIGAEKEDVLQYARLRLKIQEERGQLRTGTNPSKTKP